MAVVRRPGELESKEVWSDSKEMGSGGNVEDRSEAESLVADALVRLLIAPSIHEATEVLDGEPVTVVSEGKTIRRQDKGRLGGTYIIGVL